MEKLIRRVSHCHVKENSTGRWSSYPTAKTSMYMLLLGAGYLTALIYIGAQEGAVIVTTHGKTHSTPTHSDYERNQMVLELLKCKSK